ncbi:MAG: pitrilysin family protein [Gemmatimonadaceae bacterium]
MSILRRFIAIAGAGMALSGVAGAQRSTKLPGRPTALPAAKPFQFPAFTLDTLSNGLRFAVIENHEIPMVTVRTAFAGYGPYGTWFLDPAGKEGAWGILLSMLREGTTTRSTTQIVDETADLGSEFLHSVPTTFNSPMFRSAKSTWVPTLALFGDLLMNPSIPTDRFERLQTTTATALDRLSATTQATRLLFSTMFGSTSEYSRFATSASVKALTRDDLVAMKQMYLGPQNAIFVIGGDVTRAEVRRALTEVFGNWERATSTVAPMVPSVPQVRAPTTIYLKDAPGQANPVFTSGQVMPGRDHGDGAAIEVLASVLGDAGVSSGSRVYRAFRTDAGLSYGPNVQLGSRPSPENVVLVGSFSVAPTAVEQAVNLWVQVVRDLKGPKPILESELEFSKNNLIGGLPISTETLDGMTLQVINALRSRLPPTYLNEWITRVSGLTLGQAQAAATQYLDPEHMPIVVIGDRSKIEAGLRATGFPVVIVEK